MKVYFRQEFPVFLQGLDKPYPYQFQQEVEYGNRKKCEAVVSVPGFCSGATLVGKTVATNLVKLVPGAGSVVGGAISAGTAGVVTLAMGKAFIEVCKAVKMGKLSEEDVTSSKGTNMLKKAFKDQLRKNNVFFAAMRKKCV